jgi:hypothetical protein
VSYQSITFKALRDGITEDLNETSPSAAYLAKVTSYINQGLDMAYPWLLGGWPELRVATSQTVTSQAITFASITTAIHGISRILCVSKNHPWKNTNPQFQDFTITDDGITLTEDVTETSLYVGHIPQPPTFTSTAWSAATPIYNVGDLVYNAPNCYQCIAIHAPSGSFATDLANLYWVALTIPAFLKTALRTSVVGEFTTHSNGQVETGNTFMRLMESQLERIADRYEAARY